MQNRICLTQAQNDVPVPDVPGEGEGLPGTRGGAGGGEGGGGGMGVPSGGKAYEGALGIRVGLPGGEAGQWRPFTPVLTPIVHPPFILPPHPCPPIPLNFSGGPSGLQHALSHAVAQRPGQAVGA